MVCTYPKRVDYWRTRQQAPKVCFEEALKSIDVPVFSLPSGLSLYNWANSHKKIYVPYNFMEKANDTYKILFDKPEKTE